MEGEGRGEDRQEEVTHCSPPPTEGRSGEDVLSMRGRGAMRGKPKENEAAPSRGVTVISDILSFLP